MFYFNYCKNILTFILWGKNHAKFGISYKIEKVKLFYFYQNFYPFYFFLQLILLQTFNEIFPKESEAKRHNR